MKTFALWQKVGGGGFALIDGAIVTQPDSSGQLGLLFYAREAFADFRLRLQLHISSPTDNSGVFVRSRDPRRPVPDRNNPAILHTYNNQHWVAVDTGFEIQIDDTAAPDGQDQHRTGAIYGAAIGGQPGQQNYQRPPALAAGQWNDYEIEVRGDTYTVRLNGVRTTTFTNTDAYRGRAATAADPTRTSTGFLGLQTHTGQVAFRNIQIADL